MNQTDYKAIAKIMDSYNFVNCPSHQESIVDDLADYFEEESSLKCCCEIPHIHKCKKEKIFDRKQFIKDCGVE